MFSIGCVGNQSYRRGDVLPNQGAPTIRPIDGTVSKCYGAVPCVRTLDRHLDPQRFYLSYVEFDDMGELWSIGDLHGIKDRPQNAHPSQLEQAVSMISSAKEEAKQAKAELIVVTFVHGWKNNASDYDEKKKNLAGFKTVLQELSDYSAGKNGQHKTIIVGVFVAWRGQVVAGNLFTSYWNRRDAASRVGGPSMTEAISRLMFATKVAPPSPDATNHCQEHDPDPSSHFVIIGHSFGARVLERAVTQPILTLLLERQSQAEFCMQQWNTMHQKDLVSSVGFQSPADLIVFLNPANDAFETKATIEAFKRSELSFRRSDNGVLTFPGPLMLSITSAGDYATGKIMPIAQTLSIPGRAFRRYDASACEEGQIGQRSQTYFFRHNDGNIKEMLSHTVVYLPAITTQKNCPDTWPDFWANVDGHGRCFAIKQLDEQPADKTNRGCPTDSPDDIWNSTPFFVMHVPSELIPSHTDIFQEGSIKLLVTMIDNYDALRPTAMLVPAPSASVPLHLPNR
jgi:hypothetical protein